MKTFLISDTHFNHENIIKYCNRPFSSIYEMNESIINNWNKIVSPEDLIYHLGDFGFGSNEEISEMLSKLNGTKILIRGNHDLRRGVNGWKTCGFSEVYKNEIRLGKYVLTHRPTKVEAGYINIFGHIHDRELYGDFDKSKHINVSVDVTGFTPVEFNEEKGIIANI